MGRFLVGWLSCVVAFITSFSVLHGQEKSSVEQNYGGDLVIEWFPGEYQHGQRIQFTINNRRISDGEQGMREVVERVRKMPKGGAILYGGHPELVASGPGGVPAARAAFPELWRELQKIVKERSLSRAWFGNLNNHQVLDPHHWDLETDKTKPPTMDLQWRNYPVKGTPHSQVVYLVNGRYVGMGDAGFDEVLKRARALPANATLLYDEYAMHDKPAITATAEERLSWQKLIPFVAHEPELNRVIAERQLQTQRLRNLYWPKPHYEDFFDEHQPLAYYATMLRIATIVRDGHEPRLPKIKLTWKWNRAKLQDEYQKTPKAALTDEAIYYINGVQVGAGLAGFQAAMERIKSCQAGDVIQISPACIRTKGPFNYPLFAPGHRIFETTGTEPFRGLVDLLADVVERRRLRIELIPDEGTADLSLNPLDEEL